MFVEVQILIISRGPVPLKSHPLTYTRDDYSISFLASLCLAASEVEWNTAAQHDAVPPDSQRPVHLPLLAPARLHHLTAHLLCPPVKGTVSRECQS
jgi:hypothetical protein